MHPYRYARMLMRYQAEADEALPTSSFSLPPDTPALPQATSFTDKAGNSSTDAHSPVMPPQFDSESGAPAAVFSSSLRQPVFDHAPLECQHSMAAQSTSVPTLVRLLSPRRVSAGHRPVPLLTPTADSARPRVIADSATILSFTDLRSSMEAAADHNDGNSD